ncbi:RNA-guided endonuclease InsQ/TnpB family protein [Thermovenabulum gondwanense]|uniref:Transposase n=1 Tax=Thermovenabulum gondwanense TaxID=520767 RepID=A0A161PYQ7_9FIRM|nr:RNA-guided endonuclease TnpB family protein [Thermovenabulum gondwanense]KYO67340.1 hypothetical protein ATZ99_06260 [Thermovenabulum gondwanense]
MSVQLTRDEVREAFKSFFSLKKVGVTKHNAPGFRSKNQLSPIKYVQSGYIIEGNKVTISLGRKRGDGVKNVSFSISYRKDINFERVRQLTITYDKKCGQLEARLVVEVCEKANDGIKKVAIDVGETVLMACIFDDGKVFLYSGRLIKSVRRYWQKVRKNLKTNSQRWKQISHRENRQVEQLLHIATTHFIEQCLENKVGEIAVGNLNGIRKNINFNDSMRLHAWPYRKLIEMLKYKGALAGIMVRDDINESRTSITCHACGKVLASNRVYRGLYKCSCGWKVHADINGALNIFEKAYKVSPLKGSSGFVAKPAAVSFYLGWNGVAEPIHK